MCKCLEGILRFILIIFNILLAVAGIALIAVGGVLAVEFGKFAREDIFEQQYLWGTVAIAIIVGILLLFVGIFGFCGLCCKNKCLLKSFVIFLLIIILLEIVVIVVVFVYRDEGEESAQTAIQNLLNTTYSTASSNTREVMDDLQRDFDCCGGFGIEDYNTVNVVFNSTTNTSDIPVSCCRDRNAPTCTGVIATSGSPLNATYYSDGCGTKLFDAIGRLGIGAIVIAIIFAILQILGMILACKYINEDDGKSV